MCVWYFLPLRVQFGQHLSKSAKRLKLVLPKCTDCQFFLQILSVVTDEFVTWEVLFEYFTVLSVLPNIHNFLLKSVCYFTVSWLIYWIMLSPRTICTTTIFPAHSCLFLPLLNTRRNDVKKKKKVQSSQSVSKHFIFPKFWYRTHDPSHVTERLCVNNLYTHTTARVQPCSFVIPTTGAASSTEPSHTVKQHA